jgi:hypothetical protein
MLHQIVEDIIKNHGHTIKCIAKETGLSEKTIRLIYSKKISNPRSKTTLRLLNLYFALQYRKSLLDKESLDYFNQCYQEILSRKKKQ